MSAHLFPARRFAADGLALAVLLLAVVALYTPLFVRVYPYFPYDFSLHAGFAEQLVQTGVASSPHIAYHLLLIGLHGAGLSWMDGTIVLAVSAMAASAVLVYALLRLNALRRPRPAIAALLTAGLLVVGPIWMVRLPLPDMAFGWIMPTMLHNPTQLFLRPLALLMLLVFGRALQGSAFSAAALVGSLLVAALCVWMKPNYALALLPAAGLIAAWRVWKRQRIGVIALALLAGVLIVSLVVQVAWQRANDPGSDAMIIAPLSVLRARFAPSYAWVIIKIVMSLPFPVLAVVALRGRLAGKPEVWLAFAALLVAVLQMTLLAEAGRRNPDGNWLWGAQAALWICFVLMARELAAHPGARHARWLRLLLTVHIVAGAAYVAYLLLAADPFVGMMNSAPG